MNFLIWRRRRKSLRRRIKALEEENSVLRACLMEQPMIVGNYLKVRRNGVMEEYVRINSG